MKDWEKQLLNPFKQDEVEWRVQQCGISNGRPWAMVLCYVTARACQNRLDEVFGMDGWSDTYEHKDNGVKCKLEFVSPSNGRVVAKENGAPETQVEGFKGGFSKSFVRVCSNIGIGRYLYNLTECFADCSDKKINGWNKAQTKDRKTIWWNPPVLPAWALPQSIITDDIKDFDIDSFANLNVLDNSNLIKFMREQFKIEKNDCLNFSQFTDEMKQYIFNNQKWFIDSYKLGD